MHLLCKCFCYFLLLSEPLDVEPVLDTVPAVPIFLGMVSSRRDICKILGHYNLYQCCKHTSFITLAFNSSWVSGLLSSSTDSSGSYSSLVKNKS